MFWAWRHSDVTHVPLVTRLSSRCVDQKKSWFWPPYSVFFLTFGMRGVWGYFRGLRMRSRSTRKWAHRNAGDLGSRLAVCACAYDPIHVTAQGKRLGPNCACVRLLGSPLNKTMPRMWIQLLCTCVLYSMGSRGFPCPYMGIVTSIWSHGRNVRFWLVEKNFAALWLVRT